MKMENFCKIHLVLYFQNKGTGLVSVSSVVMATGYGKFVL